MDAILTTMARDHVASLCNTAAAARRSREARQVARQRRRTMRAQRRSHRQDARRLDPVA